MSSVLFIVTIPTRAEEERLQKLSMVKVSVKSDDNCAGTAVVESLNCQNLKKDLQEDYGRVKMPTITKTSTFIAENSNLEQDTPTERSKMLTTDDASIKDSNDLQTVNIQSKENSNDLSCGNQYDTFPKRKKSQKHNKYPLVNDYLFPNCDDKNSLNTENTKTEDSGSSFKDIATTDSLEPLRKSWEGLPETKSLNKQKSKRKKSTIPIIDLAVTDTSMEAVLKDIINKFKIQNALWSSDASGRFQQVFFNVEFDEKYEKILENFDLWGIGDRQGSTISVVNCIASKTFSHSMDDDLNNNNTELSSVKNNLAQKRSAWEKFMNSVRSRLNVAQIVRNVRQDAAITFDFVVLLIAAAILASFGLIENSTIFLASSMLISPLMGPIIAAIFGTVIKDSSLRKLGLKNELFGILTAIGVGFLFGLIVCSLDDSYSISEGMTSEMLSRCELHSLIVGVFTAIASGAAAAIGILGGNVGSLVGVAISASLLPPAVNSGLVWSLAVIYKIFEGDNTRYNNVVQTRLYSQNQAIELAVLGSISMCLTISNVLCIYIMGILVLKIKEIAPTMSLNNRDFWKHDIKIARNLSRNGYDADTAIIDEFANLPKVDQKALGIDYELWRKTLHMDEPRYQNTWSPLTAKYHLVDSNYESMNQNYRTVHRIERFYSTTSNPPTVKGKWHYFGLSKKPTNTIKETESSYKILNENTSKNVTILENNPHNASSSRLSFQPTCCTPSQNDEPRHRKFIVTPAEQDPLKPSRRYTDDFDV